MQAVDCESGLFHVFFPVQIPGNVDDDSVAVAAYRENNLEQIGTEQAGTVLEDNLTKSEATT